MEILLSLYLGLMECPRWKVSSLPLFSHRSLSRNSKAPSPIGCTGYIFKNQSLCFLWKYNNQFNSMEGWAALWKRHVTNTADTPSPVARASAHLSILLLHIYVSINRCTIFFNIMLYTQHFKNYLLTQHNSSRMHMCVHMCVWFTYVF